MPDSPSGSVRILSPVPGQSAYEVAVQNGFKGTQEQWLLTLQGSTGPRGQSLINRGPWVTGTLYNPTDYVFDVSSGGGSDSLWLCRATFPFTSTVHPHLDLTKWLEVTSSTGPAGPGVPTGGSTGQVLKKNSGTNFDTSWATTGAGDTISDISSSTINQVAIFSDTSGKHITNFTGSGIIKATSGAITTITDNSSNWDAAAANAFKWDGGATGLTASTGRTSLGANTVGSNIFTLTNPSAVSFIKIAADNSVSTRLPSQLKADLSLVSADVGLGSVTNDVQTKASIVPNTVPSSGQVLAGNAGGTAYAPVTVSGSGATITCSSAGLVTISGIANASLANSAITIAGTSTSLGGSINLDTITGLGSTGLVKRSAANTLAIATAKTDYWDTTVFVASGGSHAIGLVPDPGSSAGSTKFLREDATWAFPPGGGGGSIASTASVLKGDGSGNAIAAVADTDFLSPVSKQDVADTDATITSGKGIVNLTTTLTAARVLTLPAASAYNPTHWIIVVDPKSVVTSSNKVSVARAGSDTINGGTSNVDILVAAGSAATLVSDGVSKWITVTNIPGATAWGAITGTLSSQTDLQTALDAKTDKSTTLTIAGTALDLSANRAWTLDTITGVSSNGYLKRTGANTLTNVASIGNADLANSAITIAGTSTALGSSITLDTISGVSANGFLKRTGANTWTNDSSTYLTTASAASTYQPLDSDLTTIAGLTATTDNFMISASSAWASRTPAQALTSLGATTTGTNILKVADPSAISFIKIAADNSVSTRTPAQVKTDLSLVSSDVGLGSVTNDAQTKAAIVPNTVPALGQILVGNIGGTAYAAVTLSGAGATMSMGATGVISLSAIANATLTNSSVTINGTANQITGGGSVSLGGTLTLATPQNLDTAATIQFATVQLGTLLNSPASNWIIAGRQSANNRRTFILQRQTDTSPTGDFISCYDAGATPAKLFNVDITGTITVGVWNGTAIANANLANSTITIGGTSTALGGSVLGSVTNDAQTKAAIVPNTAPSAGQILAGNAGGTAYAPVSLSGSGATATLSSAGVLTLSAIANATLTNSAITIAGTSTSLGSSITLDTITGVSSNGLLKRTGANTLTNVTAPTGAVVGDTDTQTLTNKRVTKRVSSTSAPGATPTINTDNQDVVNLTSLGTAITNMSTNMSGSPVDGDMMRIAFTDNGTARAITWGTKFEASGNVALPSTTVISVRLDVGFVWNTVTSKWRCVAVA